MVAVQGDGRISKAAKEVTQWETGGGMLGGILGETGAACGII